MREKIGDYDLQILTDDWSRYDANDAIVRTSFLNPEEMKAFGDGYEKEMTDDWNKIVRRYHEGRAPLKIKCR